MKGSGTVRSSEWRIAPRWPGVPGGCGMDSGSCEFLRGSTG